MKPEPYVARYLLAAAALLLSLPGVAELPGADPSINRYYLDPDWDRWVNTFERPGREVFDKRLAIVEASNPGPGMDIADIGAGTGLFTRLFAPRVEPGGTVYAIDISRPFIENILKSCREQGITNVKGIVNTQTGIGLPPGSIDLAIIVDTYHHFEKPGELLGSVHKALRGKGRVIIIDFRKDPQISSPWVMGHVRGNREQVINELQEAGFRLLDDKPLLTINYFLEFVKSE